MNYDLNLLLAINNLAGRNIVVDYLGIFLANYLAYGLIIFLVIFFFWFRKNRFKNIVMMSVAFFSALFARFVVKSFILLFYDRPRPYAASSMHLVMSPIHQLISTSFGDNWQSFPSGHAIFFFALSTALCFYNKKLGWSFLVASAVMGIARVFTGVHWPSDILAGAILGALVAYLTQAVYVRWKKKINPVLKKVFAFLL